MTWTPISDQGRSEAASTLALIYGSGQAMDLSPQSGAATLVPRQQAQDGRHIRLGLAESAVVLFGTDEEKQGLQETIRNLWNEQDTGSTGHMAAARRILGIDDERAAKMLFQTVPGMKSPEAERALTALAGQLRDHRTPDETAMADLIHNAKDPAPAPKARTQRGRER